MSSGSGVEYGYRVEVRDANFSTSRPHTLADGLVGPDWRTISFPLGDNPAGVPADTFYGYKIQHDLLEYSSALALAHTVIAQESCFSSLECRIVRHKLEYTFKVERQGVVDLPAIKAQRGRVELVKDEGKEGSEDASK